MNELLVAVIPKSKREEIRVTIGSVKGRDIITIRTWFAADGGMRPSSSGITIPLRYLPAVSAALVAATQISPLPTAEGQS